MYFRQQLGVSECAPDEILGQFWASLLFLAFSETRLAVDIKTNADSKSSFEKPSV